MVLPVVKRSEEIEELDLEGGGKIRWLITHKDGADKYSMRLITIHKGKSTPSHQHDYEHEIFVISGEGETILDGKRYQVNSNDFIFIPGGIHHVLNAYSDMKVICVVPISTAMKILGK